MTSQKNTRNQETLYQLLKANDRKGIIAFFDNMPEEERVTYLPVYNDWIKRLLPVVDKAWKGDTRDLLQMVDRPYVKELYYYSITASLVLFAASNEIPKMTPGIRFCPEIEAILVSRQPKWFFEFVEAYLQRTDFYVIYETWNALRRIIRQVDIMMNCYRFLVV